MEVLGHGPDRVVVKGTQHFRIEKRSWSEWREPLWLKAFKGTTATSDRLADRLVDGRNVPLTVGEHKVAVDIRDQIARTIIEERSSTTPTASRGRLHFPLPADASISGFAMWINGNMVEADVVEKQRAREIYETILLEKRDPGLLEWSGGNIFKARVFPSSPTPRNASNHLHPGAAAKKAFIATVTPCKANCCSSIPARAGHRREGEFRPAAQERHVADASERTTSTPPTPPMSSSRLKNTRRTAISRSSSKSRAGQRTWS